MTVENIIKAVRWCFDEEDANPSSLYNQTVLGSDNTLMNNIITSKIGDALRWVCLYAPAELLGGSDEEDSGEPVETGILVDETPTDVDTITGGGGRITLDSDFIKLARVRVSGWHRAVIDPITEDSDEYLQLYDSNGATATKDRPQAAIINSATRKLEVWPWSPASGTDAADSVEYTYVAAVDAEDIKIGSGTSGDPYAYPLPPRVKTSFIYYLAFLTLSAYEDSRSVRMLEIAKMNLSRTENTQNK